MEYWGEKLPPRSARSPTSVHVNACALATVRSRRSVTSEEPSIHRTRCCVYMVQPTPRTCPLFFHGRPRAFSSRSALLAARENSKAYAYFSVRYGTENCDGACLDSISDRLKFQSSVASRAAISYLSLPRIACWIEHHFRVRFYLFRNCTSMLVSSSTITDYRYDVFETCTRYRPSQ